MLVLSEDWLQKAVLRVTVMVVVVWKLKQCTIITFLVQSPS
jgi:hypothetical protein